MSYDSHFQLGFYSVLGVYFSISISYLTNRLFRLVHMEDFVSDVGSSISVDMFIKHNVMIETFDVFLCYHCSV